MQVRALKGFKDVLPGESYKWQYIEAKMREVTARFGFLEARSPVLEHTELFARGVGETTDIVQKEMYTFETKGRDLVTLKPEGTAGIVRQFVEHKGYAAPQPTRMYYLNCPVFRYEQPQTGRLREHHQFGAEIFGSGEPVADAEIITLALQLFAELGVEELALHINNIGCPQCRPRYNEALRAYFAPLVAELCEDCRTRIDKNPLRMLDCKKDHEQNPEIMENAPKIAEYVCEDCQDHFVRLEKLLQIAGINYVVDDRLVRGLDYYSRVVFEVISRKIGAQGTVCGGGRYDALIEEIGGPDMPGVGFGMGMERLLLVMEGQGITIPQPKTFSLYIANYGERAKECTWALTNALRKRGVAVCMDMNGRSMKAQFKYADKLGTPYVAVIGEEELDQKIVKLRDMRDHEEKEIALDDFVNVFLQCID